MLRSPHPLSLLLASGLITWSIAGCVPSSSRGPASRPPVLPSPSPPPLSPSPPAASPSVRPSDPYAEALQRGASAAQLSQMAQSQDDWQLAADRWQQAIALLAAVPPTSPNYAQAQAKRSEYGRNLALAQRQSSRPILPEEQIGVRRSPQPRPTASSPPGAANRPISPRSPRSEEATAQLVPSAPNPLPPNAPSSFSVPIVRRERGTPVIRVTFNGSQTYDMVLDTGASGTVVTAPMAAELNLRPAGSATVSTASETDLTFPLGYVASLNVGGVERSNFLVAIAPPTLEIGLLGQDFFGQYDVTLRQNVVEFHPR